MLRLVIPHTYTSEKKLLVLKRTYNATCSIIYSIYALKTPCIYPLRNTQIT
jgi:hypothetical protein